MPSRCHKKAWGGHERYTVDRSVYTQHQCLYKWHVALALLCFTKENEGKRKNKKRINKVFLK